MTIKNTFFHDDLVWVRSENMHRAAVARVDKVFQSGDHIWAEVIVGPSDEPYYYDWDEQHTDEKERVLPMTDHPIMQVPIYRLEHVKFEKVPVV